MINIYLDESQLNENTLDINFENYPKFYSEILELIKLNIDKDIFINNRRIFHWVRFIEKSYPGNISLIELDLRSFISKQYNIKIYENYSENEIRDNKNFLVNSKYSNLTDSILANINVNLTDKKYTSEIFSSYINLYDEEKEKLIKENKIVKKALKIKSRTWKEKASLKEKKEIDYFISNFEELVYLVNEYKVSKVYKITIGQREFNEEIISKIIVPHNDKYLSGNVKESLEISLNTLLYEDNSYEKIKDILLNSIGYTTEYKIIKNKIFSDTTLQNKEIVELILDKFILSENNIKELKSIIKPEYPLEPKFNTTNEWIKWIKEEYFIYKKWLINNKLEDKIIENYGEVFSNWYFENYFSVIFEENFISKAIFSEIEKIKSDEYSIILIIDNLNFYFAEELEKIILKNKLYIKEKKDYLTTLPSETEYGKYALLSGNVDYKKSFNVKNTSLKLDKIFNTKNIVYTSNINEAEQICKRYNNDKEEIMILNYNNIDDIMHDINGKSAISTKEKAVYELEALFKRIKEILNIFLDKNFKANLYICTDHGSYYLPKEKEAIDNNLFKGKDRNYSKSERCIKVEDEFLNNYENVIKEYTYILNKDKFGINENLCISKSNNFFAKSKGDLYYHGGISPEEILVPFYRVSFEKDEIPNIKILLIENIFRYNVKQNLEIEIINENRYEIKIASIKINDTNITGNKEDKNIVISGKSKENIIFNNLIFDRKFSQNFINIKVLIDRFGEIIELKPFRLELKFKSLQEFDSNVFDDLDF